MKSPAANGGWVKSYRSKWEHPIFRNKLEAGVWAWMCDCAAFESMTLQTKFGPVELRRGEILIAQRWVAKDFGMARKTLRSLLERLQNGCINPNSVDKKGTAKEPMVELIKARCPHRLGTIVRIINYDKYQEVNAQRTLDLREQIPYQGPAKGPQNFKTGPARGPSNKELKEVKKDSMVDSAFEEFWKAYPSRSPASNPRKPALEKFRAKVKSGTPAEDIIRGAEGFTAAVEQRRAREGDAFDSVTAVCQAVTFINQDRWEQYMGEAEAPLTEEQRAVLARHNGGKRKWSTPNVVELKLGPGPPEEAYEAAMDAYERACTETGER